MYYNRFRYYNPESGLYLSQDPIGLKGGHRLYGYVGNINSSFDIFGLADCKIHHYPGDADNPYGHYSIEVNDGTTSIHTHQVITSEDLSTTTITDNVSFLGKPDKTVEFDLPNSKGAIDYQNSQLGKELGPYNQRTNSCVDHVSEVTREGGVDVQKSALGQFKFLKSLGF